MFLRKSLCYLTSSKHDYTSARRISNWNPSVTGHKEGRSAFPSQNSCQGQVQTHHSVSIHDSSALEFSREKEMHCKQNSYTTERCAGPSFQLRSFCSLAMTTLNNVSVSETAASAFSNDRPHRSEAHCTFTAQIWLNTSMLIYDQRRA